MVVFSVHRRRGLGGWCRGGRDGDRLRLWLGLFSVHRRRGLGGWCRGGRDGDRRRLWLGLFYVHRRRGLGGWCRGGRDGDRRRLRLLVFAVTTTASLKDEGKGKQEEQTQQELGHRAAFGCCRGFGEVVGHDGEMSLQSCSPKRLVNICAKAPTCQPLLWRRDPSLYVRRLSSWAKNSSKVIRGLMESAIVRVERTMPRLQKRRQRPGS